ncbi:MAG: dihydropteroate synthase [Cyanobacteria bacterium SIG31]|nr:dihydropteroate synthase [Cyanobacteria bacterium SIG31]
MEKFCLKTLIANDIESELEKIGFDTAYRAKGADKFRYKTLKIFGLTVPQANILKQTALSFGADCGVHREVLTNNINKTDVILGGSYSQIKKICEKLKQQPFSLKFLSENILEELEPQKRETKLVGILNITPDSFSDGGKYFKPQDAIKHLYQLIEDGADIIDIGAESTKHGADDIPAEEQINRLRPILTSINDLPVPLSIDTRSAKVAQFALENGISIINDVSGLTYDSKLSEVVVQYNASIVLQHSTNKTSEIPLYNDIVEDVYLDLHKKAQIAKSKGIKNIILDIGIGFGKNREHNLELLKRFEEFHSLNYPLMVGISRKSFLGVKDDNELKDSLTLALSYPLINTGIDYLRVHNVKLHKQLLNSVI